MTAAPHESPTARLGTVMLLAGVVYALLAVAIHVLTPPSPDSAIFDYMGWRVLAGDRLYVDVIEQNWPGAVWVHMLSTALFGNTWWSFRLLDAVLMLLASLALFKLGHRSGLRWTGWIAAALYPMMYMTTSPWLTGQRDALVAHLLVMGMALYLAARGRWGGPAMVVFGLLCALSVMIRPTYLLFPALVVLLELAVHLFGARPIGPLLRGASVAALAFAVPLALVAAHGWQTGGLAGWWEAAIRYNLSVYSGSAGLSTYTDELVLMARSWHWYLVFGAAGSLLWWRTGERWAWWLAMAFAVTCVVSFVVQGKGFGYHLAGWLPLLALFTGHLLAWAADTLQERRHRLLMVVAALLIGVALAGTARKLRALVSQVQVLAGMQTWAAHMERSEFHFQGMNMGDLLRVVDHVRANTRPDETVLVWNRGVWINFLSERGMPIPFATVGALAEFNDPSTGLARRWLDTLHRILACSPPIYVVVGARRGWDHGDGVTAVPQQPMAESDRAVLDTLRASYHLETRIGGAQLWRRLSTPTAPCPAQP